MVLESEVRSEKSTGNLKGEMLAARESQKEYDPNMNINSAWISGWQLNNIELGRIFRKSSKALITD